MRMTLVSLPALASGATGLRDLLVGAPWWAASAGVALTVLVPPVVAQARAWHRDRAEREFQDAFVQFVKELPDPQQRVRAMIDYRRAEPQSSLGGAEATGQAPSPGSAQNSADPQGP
ncbi:hypothetical protein [Streptomyces sp. NPDC059631]|uniref:hypothetical protein n=1 Tax=unclassified Streptomyces TaxID=2593676 RepID=UPI0036D145FF